MSEGRKKEVRGWRRSFKSNVRIDWQQERKVGMRSEERNLRIKSSRSRCVIRESFLITFASYESQSSPSDDVIMDTFLRYIASPRDVGIDYRVAKLPLMTTSAWTVAAFASLYLTSLLFLIPNWFKSHKNLIDMRPVMLIFYGFQFGIHGIGLALFYLTMDLSTSWTCERVDQSPTDIKTMGLIYSAYLLFSVKIIALFEPVLQAITSESSFTKDRNLIGTSCRLLFHVNLLAMAMKANPGHAFLWIAMSDMAVELVHYGYRALTSASSEMLPDSKWTGVISAMRSVQAASLMLHGLYLSSHSHCSMPKSVAFVECVYALLVLTLEALDFVRRRVRKAHPE